jgi:hypothetical protein
MYEMMFLVIAAHFVCDYTLQTEAVAIGKNRSINKTRFGVDWWYWMMGHSFTHGVALYLITGSVAAAVCDTFTHFMIDDSKCAGIFGIHVDQALHIVWRVLVVAILSY